MDLVITVDTFAAHLAGALGVSAWVMLQHAADWRWLARSESSPWYPSLRLFRQPAPGDWPAVTEQVGQALHQWRRVYDGAQTAEKSTVSAA
jgi:ADP-heptose:LPS heptosyltransferase